MSANSGPWPEARLDPVRRLRVLAAAMVGAAFDERIVPAPFDQVWGYLADMERSIPEFDQAVGELRILSQAGERLVVRARTPRLRVPVTFDVDLQPGWCLMTTRLGIYVVGFAAAAEDGQTRFAHVEAYLFPGPAWVRRPLRRLLAASRRRLGAHVRADADGIEAAVIGRGPA